MRRVFLANVVSLLAPNTTVILVYAIVKDLLCVAFEHQFWVADKFGATVVL